MAFGPWGGAAIGAAGDLVGGLVGAFKNNPYATNIRPEYASMFNSLPEGLKGFHTPEQQRLMMGITRYFSNMLGNMGGGGQGGGQMPGQFAGMPEGPISMPAPIAKQNGGTPTRQELLQRAIALRNQIG